MNDLESRVQELEKNVDMLSKAMTNLNENFSLIATITRRITEMVKTIDKGNLDLDDKLHVINNKIDNILT